MNDPQEFYLPGAAGSEAGLAERLARWKALKEEMQRTEKA